MMWPTLASLLEERLSDDPRRHARRSIHALNQWMHEQWTFNYEDRIFPTPVITLPIVERGDRGARVGRRARRQVILIRPAPVPGFEGTALVRAARVRPVLGEGRGGRRRRRHARLRRRLPRTSTSGKAGGGEYLPFGERSAFEDAFRHQHRGDHRRRASAVGHGLCTRFPALRIMPVENGRMWVRPLLELLEHDVRARTRTCSRRTRWRCSSATSACTRSTRRTRSASSSLIGADNVLFGSDYPHPEGLATRSATSTSWTAAARRHRRIMGGNLADA